MRTLLFIFFQILVLTIFAQDTTAVNIDLGGTNSSFPWNNLSNSFNGNLQNLFDKNGNQTEIDIEVNDSFNGTNNTGTTMPVANLDFPSTATEDSFFGNTEEFGGNVDSTAAITLSDLDVNKTYDLSLFASRIATNNRETQYNIHSSVNDTLFLNVSDNTDTVLKLDGLSPRPDGTIEIQCRRGPNNNSDFGFFYIGIIRLEFESDLGPIEPFLSLTHPNGGEYWQSGKNPEIRWKSQGLGDILIEFSHDNGANWENIATTPSVTRSYEWTIPDQSSEDCLIRISADTLVDQSMASFEIPEEDSLNCHIVVLGSSTAAGTGPTSVDSAWVWMFRDTLFQRDTRFQVTNLAQGGFTTYNILPTGTTIPININQTVNIDRNVTMALSLEPDAIIINLPSNDAANQYPVVDQLNNYDLISDPLQANEIPFWICTPQPRNGFNTSQLQIQTDMRDSTFTRYGDFAIDFWNGLADSFGFIDPIYNSGDDVHLNNAAHSLLLQRVLNKNINLFLLDEKDTTNPTAELQSMLSLKIYPNPTHGKITIALSPPFSTQLFNRNGQLLKSSINKYDQSIDIEASGLLFLVIEKNGQRYGNWFLNQ